MNPVTLYLWIIGTRRLAYATGYTLFAVYLLRVVETTPFELVLPLTPIFRRALRG